MATMLEGKKTRREHSCGGVVVSVEDGMGYVAMIATRGRSRWGLPKGAVTKGETPEQAALREVEEETGLRATILRQLDTIEYFFRAGDTLIHKKVDFYLMRYDDGDLQPQLSEVDDVAWVELHEAVDRSSFESERKLLLLLRDEWDRLMEDERTRLYDRNAHPDPASTSNE